LVLRRARGRATAKKKLNIPKKNPEILTFSIIQKFCKLLVIFSKSKTPQKTPKTSKFFKNPQKRKNPQESHFSNAGVVVRFSQFFPIYQKKFENSSKIQIILKILDVIKNPGYSMLPAKKILASINPLLKILQKSWYFSKILSFLNNRNIRKKIFKYPSKFHYSRNISKFFQILKKII
jgi:hypothetical protein